MGRSNLLIVAVACVASIAYAQPGGSQVNSGGNAERSPPLEQGSTPPANQGGAPGPTKSTDGMGDMGGNDVMKSPYACSVPCTNATLDTTNLVSIAFRKKAPFIVSNPPPP